MKLSHTLYILIIVNIVLTGCMSKSLPPTPAQAATQTLSPTQVPLTATSIPSPTQTATLTPPATLEPEQAQETIQALLREPVDCDAPCFWGIMPGQTTLGEAVNIFTRLGLQVKYTNARDHKKSYEIGYEFDSSLSTLSLLTTQNDIVENLRVYITPEKQMAGVPRMWSAYSPEFLINRYGLPSNVDFKTDWGPRTFFAMDMYFDKMDLIVEYSGYGIIDEKLNICPLTFQFDSVQIWMGKNPVNPPSSGILLEEAASMTMEEFSELIAGNPNKACFNLKVEMFR